MKNTAEIKKENQRRIWEILRDGLPHTKQEAARITGLSPATCNTILNELKQEGQVLGEKKRSGEVGRASVAYILNRDYENFLCIGFELIQGRRSIFWRVLTATCEILDQGRDYLEKITCQDVEDKIRELKEKFPNMRAAAMGTPSVADKGWIHHCDLPEFDNVPVMEILEKKFHFPVHLENDMHYKVYGYYLKECSREDTVTILNYPSHVLPGMGTVVEGKVIKGWNQFAGMVGFLPYGVSREEQIDRLVPGSYLPFLSKGAASVIPLLNPRILVFTGDLVEEEHIEKIRKYCAKTVPEAYLPEFVRVPDITEYYFAGMFERAVEERWRTRS